MRYGYNHRTGEWETAEEVSQAEHDMQTLHRLALQVRTIEHALVQIFGTKSAECKAAECLRLLLNQDIVTKSMQPPEPPPFILHPSAFIPSHDHR